jgi:hypothetical protein
MQAGAETRLDGMGEQDQHAQGDLSVLQWASEAVFRGLDRVFQSSVQYERPARPRRLTLPKHRIDSGN